MMDAAAEVARIKSDFAARDAAWLAAVRGRLADGHATTRELAEACGCDSRGAFTAFLYALKRAGTLVVVGSRPGPTGFPNSLWGLPA